MYPACNHQFPGPLAPSVNSLQLGYQIGIEAQVSSEIGDKILSSLQEET